MAEGIWNRDLFSSTLSTALSAALDGVCGADSLRRAVAECATAAEAACYDRGMACGPGCPYCCVLNVAILLPEGMIIADWMRERLPPEILGAMGERLAAHCRRVRWMDDEERIFAGIACPFLDGAGNCLIHPVRPLACRGAASLDRDSCREAFAPLIADQERLVPADLLRRAVYDTAFMALARALRQHGLDDRSIELGAGVLAFLRRQEAGELFLSGRRLPREGWDWN
jgi:Fe-S-cluster containining protein